MVYNPAYDRSSGRSVASIALHHCHAHVPQRSSNTPAPSTGPGYAIGQMGNDVTISGSIEITRKPCTLAPTPPSQCCTFQRFATATARFQCSLVHLASPRSYDRTKLVFGGETDAYRQMQPTVTLAAIWRKDRLKRALDRRILHELLPPFRRE